MIEIDGSAGEGGGQMLRTALALSTITKKAFKIKNIRKGRCAPGIKNQHLYCINALKELSGARTLGAKPGSTSLEFEPAVFKPKNISIDVGTAGSITLVLQSVMIPFIVSRKPVTISLTGGTDVKWSQPIDYFKYVVLSQLRQFAELKLSILRRGYYPKGAGRVELKIAPKIEDVDGDFRTFHKRLMSSSRKISITKRGKLLAIRGVSHSSAELEKARVSERQTGSAKGLLSRYRCPIEINNEYCCAESAGSGITLYALFESPDYKLYPNSIIGADCLGKKGKPAESVGREAAERLIAEIDSGEPVDEHLADNLIPYIGLFGGEIAVSSISQHTMTNIMVAEMFLGGKFSIVGNSISYGCI